MADTSRSHVTITLGRSGQVVKRSRAEVDGDFGDPVPAAGIKRPVRDRLGSNVDAVRLDNKRHRGVNGRSSGNSSNDVDDTHLSKHDLRFKIMKRNESNDKQKNVDLRDLLSRKSRPSSTNQKPHQTPPEPRNSRHRAPEFTPEQKDDRRIMWAPVEVNPPRMHKLYDDRQPNLDPSRLASTRTSRTLSQMDLSKTSFSLESLDHISRPSPPPTLPPPVQEPLRRPLMRAFDDPRQVPVPYTSRDIREMPRPMATTSFPIKPPISNVVTKPVGPVGHPTGGMVHQSQYPVDYLTLEGFLHSLGLDKYLISFKVEEVDMATLSQMGEHDLKELNIPMGPRKKILLALHARNRKASTMRAMVTL